MKKAVKPRMNLMLPGDYCDDCPYFDPKVKRNDIYASGIRVDTLRHIVCKNEGVCNNIYDYLAQTFKDKKETKKTCENCEHHFPGSPYCLGCDGKNNWRRIDE